MGSQGLRSGFARSNRLLIPFVTVLAVAACNRGGGGGGGTTLVQAPSGESSELSLSGTIVDPTGSGIAGVTVSVLAAPGARSAITNGDGHFILVGPPAGTQTVLIDGTTATAPGRSFPPLQMMVEIAAGGNTPLPQAISLPDLLVAEAANADDVLVDGAGAATQDRSAAGATPNLELDIFTGTVVTIAGAPPSGSFDLNATPVAPQNVPMPLSTPSRAVDARFYVTIQPPDAAFDSGGGLGIDLTLPNSAGLPLGQSVSIWSFDHDVEDWVDRSAQTGNMGVVVDDGAGGTRIEAAGVIVKGGWHTATIPIDLNCATTILGCVVDQDNEAIAGVYVATSLGQFTRTDESGEFTLSAVPAYDAADLPACTPVSFDLILVTPLEFGSMRQTVTVDAADVVSGGDTDVGTIVFQVSETGSIAGRVLDNGDGVPVVDVEIDGPAAASATTDTDGGFFLIGLEPGDYSAAVTFPGESAATEVGFSVALNSITTLNVQRTRGTGSRDIRVRSIVSGDGRDLLAPLGPFVVTLIGSDAASQNGLVAVANADGDAFFSAVDEPFTVTTQLDVLDLPSAECFRLAASILDIAPPGDAIGLFVERDTDSPALTSATLAGTATGVNLGPGEVVHIGVHTREFDFFNFADADGATGDYGVDVLSGRVLDVMAVHLDPDGSPIAALLVPGVGPAGSGETIDLDFDFASAAVIEFDQVVPFTHSGAAAADFADVSLEIDSTGTEFIGFEVSLFDGAPADLPASLRMPDPGDPALAGFRLEVHLTADQDVGFTGLETSCGVAIPSLPASIDVDLLGATQLDSPQPNDVLTQAQAENLTVAFTLAPSPLLVGVNNLFLNVEASGPSGAPQRSQWLLFAPTDRTSIPLPAVALPMFPDDGSLEIDVEQFRVTGPFVFDSFFDGDIESRLAEFDVTFPVRCLSALETDLLIDTP